ncbi:MULTISPECIES: RNA polymerase sigma factor SigW [Anoxybacillus]|uniref:RNA polymerase sigma factor SigW n=2 Tax=Anoxybacillus TaxID=150247 RepID=A0A178TIU8_9BACL|nr:MULTISPECIES: RNA polymerase sigma factor SigW [Anoxybacillus]MCG6196815.1 RNA polymerase sigma factor SigW [Anoxybacillus sp. LAT_38]QAV25378.1 RNA polymerase sigma factor SigW [Neobacillus thermocopriae]ASA97338.1 RNA polymerase sigma factor SigW [Anoxybacillus flavithermus]ELK20561.1 RNA polymerase sigma-W factor [Anoxybacillus flavithermus TNO-09.006]MBE2908935.1 RNA polymerase sigma factor SigW [Anoxybacillus flavithermus]
MDMFIRQRIKAVKKGDQSAFADIVEMYKDKIYQLCYRMLGNRHEAEDAAQEAFIRAYVNIHTYDPTMKFSSWLYRIATNLSIDRMRKKKPDVYLDAEVSGTDGLTMYSQLADKGTSPEDALESLELQKMVQEAILKLPEKYRTVIVLKYIDELSLQEISDILNLPIGTVKTRIHRGREALRKHLGHL